MKKLISFATLTLLFVSSAQADLAIGVLGGVRRDGYDYSDKNGSSVDAGTGSQYGALLWVPIFPMLSFRTGVMSETRDQKFKDTAVGELNVREKRWVYPLLLQFSLPLTGLSAIGGLHYAALDKAESLTSGVTLKDDPKEDKRLVLGVAYEAASLALFSLDVEGLYERSLENFSPASGVDMKTNTISANLVFKIGF